MELWLESKIKYNGEIIFNTYLGLAELTIVFNCRKMKNNAGQGYDLYCSVQKAVNAGINKHFFLYCLTCLALKAYSHRPNLGPLSTHAAPPLNFSFVEINKNDNCRHLFHFLAFQTKSTCVSLHISINWPFYAVKVLQLLKK